MSNSTPPLSPKEVLAELSLIGAEEEDITQTTINAVSAVIEDGKRKSDTKSFLTVIGYVQKKHAGLSKRIRRLELLVVFCSGGGTVAYLTLELWKALHPH